MILQETKMHQVRDDSGRSNVLTFSTAAIIISFLWVRRLYFIMRGVFESLNFGAAPDRMKVYVINDIYEDVFIFSV